LFYLPQQTIKYFEVAEYVLPKFEVTVTGQHIAGKIVATVTAAYTYGKPLSGTLIITATANSRSPPVKKVLSISGKQIVEFDVQTDLGITDQRARSVGISIEILDKLSGSTQNASTNVRIEQFVYSVVFLKNQATWKKNLPFTVKIKVTKLDGTPVPANNRIFLNLEINFGLEEFYLETHRIQKSGIVTAVFDIPFEAKTLKIKVNSELLWVSVY
jgi:hypothetical protein